jgi:choline dehydrogenase-like flavoprotein
VATTAPSSASGSWSAPVPERTDVAIVGAGPAGIVLALELAAHGLAVVLLESGGDSPDEDAQRLGDALLADEHHVAMDLATRRQLGGASNIWGGRCVPFDPVDFEQRDVTGSVSWPVAYEEIAPFFGRACEWMRCGRPVFSAWESDELAGRALVPGLKDGEVKASDLERWSLPTNFAREYGERLRAEPRVRLVEHATCTRITRGEDGTVSGLEAARPGGEGFTVEANRYVLAAGGLESTRLLMASEIGDHSGHLGRWYMAHAECRIGQVRFSTPPDETIHGHELDTDGVYVRRRFTFTPELQLEHGLPNTAMWLVNPKISDASHGNGILSFVYLVLASPFGRYAVAEGIRQAHVGGARASSAWAHLRNVIRGLPATVAFAFRFGYQRYLKRGRKVPGFFVRSASGTYPLVYHAEHVPRYGSHVRLSSERDELGVPRLETHLSFDPSEAEAAIRAHERLDTWLRRQGLGHAELTAPDPARSALEQFFGGYHQAGTTRMSTDPGDGVVDPDLAVHGVANLFVASSSTFVTSSQANSTFMIVAFALRLADHLAAQSTTAP